MPPTERVILCGGTRRSHAPQTPLSPLFLRLRGEHANVHCVVEHADLGLGTVPAPFLDLIDLAAYVYTGDQASIRGGLTDRHFGAAWRRRFLYQVPVRRPDLWARPEVTEALVAVLSFFSEDEYAFEFRPIDEPTDQQGSFFGPDQFDEVLLFSGGLDSFGGAVQEALVEGKRAVLVQHRSSEKACLRKQGLVEALQQRSGQARPFLLPIRINKDRQLGRESTQRTRSFLFAALGASAVVVLNLPRLRFYENGVVALNLPPSAQVVGAWASRTAHPRALTLLGRLLSLLRDEPLTVENPFVGHTKTEVLQGIARAGCAELIALTNSCAHPREASNAVAHCGRCSQCIDRRFAVLAAGLEQFDPAAGYQLDLLTDARAEGHPRTMLSAYVEMARRITRMRPLDFFQRYGEAARALGHLGRPEDQAADQVFQLYQRHAQEVMHVVSTAIADHHQAIADGSLPPSCLVRLVCDRGASPVLPAAPAAPRNAFLRSGQCWSIRFAGQMARSYISDLGLDYLRLLVECPGRSWAPDALSQELLRRQGKEEGKLSRAKAVAHEERPAAVRPSDDPILDREGRRRLTVRRDAVLKEIAQRKQPGTSDAEELQKLEDERTWLDRVLSTSRNHKGRARQLQDPRDRARTRVCNAIRRSLASIAKYDPALAKHFNEPVLHLGFTISYLPAEGVVWATDAGFFQRDRSVTPRVSKGTRRVSPPSEEARPGEAS